MIWELLGALAIGAWAYREGLPVWALAIAAGSAALIAVAYDDWHDRTHPTRR